LDLGELERCCDEFPFSAFRPILLKFQSDQTVAIRHWPWAAFAASYYAYEIEHRAKYRAADSSPKAIWDLINAIKKSSQELARNLSALRSLSNRLPDPKSLDHYEQVALLNEIIARAAVGLRGPPDNHYDWLQSIASQAAVGRLFSQLQNIAAASKNAPSAIDAHLLKRVRGLDNPALSNFAFRCGAIWQSLTARKPSAERLNSKDIADPDFVVFVQQIALVAQPNRAVPTRDEVATSIAAPPR
jgi:hypothetical protein